ncbi:hypothetical protein [Vibrio sp. ArtGut-C1]|uniref:hypothetical protein n=1 Tax=Vibrio sp. ArtGut-C1 TaxID=2259137 RepID=UPI000A19051F|nr:hypothetical protein [Vibrio sp. ArtGut-C1]
MNANTILPVQFVIISLLTMLVLTGCSGKYEEELAKLVETYNKIKEVKNVDELTSASLIKNYENIKHMEQANVWLKHDTSHLKLAIEQALEKEKNDKGSPLRSVSLKSMNLQQQAIIVSLRLEDFYDSNVMLKLTGSLDLYFIPMINNGNIVFNIVASDLSLKRLGIKDKDFSTEKTPLTVGLIDETINALLPHISNLIPEIEIFDKQFRLADINPVDLFKGVKCMAPSGNPRQVVAKVLQSAVIVSSSGIEIVAFAASKLIQPKNLQFELNAQSRAHPKVTTDMIAEEVANLKLRSFNVNNTRVQEAFKQPNYAIVGDVLIAYAFNLLGKSLDYTVEGTPCIEPIKIDTKMEASKVNENCKAITTCRHANSEMLKCDDAQNCLKLLRCRSCKSHDIFCHIEKYACEAAKPAAAVACFQIKGVKKAACEVIKDTANKACALVNPKELLEYPIDCGIGAVLGADNMGSLTGTLAVEPSESKLTIAGVSTEPNLANIKVYIQANLNTHLDGNIKLTPHGVLGTLLTCQLPTALKIKYDTVFDGNVVLNASKTNVEINHDKVTTHYYKLNKAKLEVKLDKSLLEGILLRNPHFIAVCPSATLIGLLDSAFGGKSGKNTMELDIDEMTFSVKVQPIIWKFRDIEYRVPVVIGNMTQEQN